MGFNNKLKELRKEKNISQEQLAKELNISGQSISRL
ncbi:helix-turn-helix transcriptional regulator [Clostridium perfringens]